MKILLLTPNFSPEVNAGATRQFEHCRRWVKAGHSVTVVAPAPNWPSGKVYPGYRNRLLHREEIDGVKVLRIWTLVVANAGFFWRTASFLSYLIHASIVACFVRKVDVVVATSPHMFSGLAGTVTCFLTRRRFVLEVRDLWPESIATVGAMKKSIAFRMLEYLERVMYQSASHIVTVGDCYKDKLVKRGVPSSKISVISNGVSLADWDASKRKSAKHPSPGSKRKFVCAYIGTVGMAHGLEVVLQAAKTLSVQGRDAIEFLIIGDGAQKQPLTELAQQMGLKNVSFLGQVSKQEVAEHLAECDATLVHLRATELFGAVIPSKIFEAMAMQVPIIMGVRGQALDIVMRAHAGVAMTPESPESLIECIESLMESPGSSTDARAFVQQFYCRDKLALKMLEVLQADGVDRYTDDGTPEDTEAIRQAVNNRSNQAA